MSTGTLEMSKKPRKPADPHGAEEARYDQAIGTKVDSKTLERIERVRRAFGWDRSNCLRTFISIALPKLESQAADLTQPAS